MNDRYIQRPGYRLYCRVDGKDGAPALLLSHSLGSDMRLWESQTDALADTYRIIRYDHPGHGRSDRRPSTGTMEGYGRDALAVLDELGIDRCVFAGVSLGGFVGIWLGSEVPARLTHCVLANTTAHIADTTLLKRRIALLRVEGLEGIIDDVIDKWVSDGFRRTHPESIALCRDMLIECGADAYADCAEAICAMDFRSRLARITCPTTVITGDVDSATPAAWGEYMARHVPDARLCMLHAAHLSNIEDADSFSAVLREARDTNRVRDESA